MPAYLLSSHVESRIRIDGDSQPDSAHERPNRVRSLAMLLERLTGHPTSGKLRAAFPKTAYQQIKGGCDVVL